MMGYRISDLMSDYADGDIELEDCQVTTAARINSITMERLNLSAAPRRRGRKLGRTLLIAAVIVMALAVTAVAVYQHTVADLIMEMPESTAYAPAEASGEAGTEAETAAVNQPFYAFTTESGRDLYYYSLAGYDKESPEYKAQQEWLYYYFCTDKVLDARELLSQSDPHRIYAVGYQPMADKLDALAEKYGLSLARAEYYLSGSYYGGETTESVYDILGVEPFIRSELDSHTGILYDEGSFEINGDLTVPGQEDSVFVNFYCAMDGTLPVFDITGEAADSMEYKTVTTDGGVTADLALGKVDSLIFVTMDNCHVLVSVSGGSAGDAMRTMTMDDLEAVANCFDYGTVDKFDRAQRSETIYGLFAETLENTAWKSEDPGREARETFSLLGDYRIAALPEDYVLYGRFCEPAEAAADSMWAAETGGGAYGAISIQYRPSGDDSDMYLIELYCGRYWQDAEMTAVNNRLGFDPAYILMDEVETADCTMNGYEAYYYVNEWNRSLCLTWLDTDRELVFRLTVPAGFTPEQAIAVAESVTEEE